MPKKKSKKHQSFLRVIQPVIRDNRVLYSLLGALGAGLALGTVLGTEKGGAIVDKLTLAVKDLGQSKASTGKKEKLLNKAKGRKPAKPSKLLKPHPMAAVPTTANSRKA